MDILQLKDILCGDSEKIRYLLESSGFLNIYKNGDEYRCQWDKKHSKGGTQVIINSLKANCYSFNIFGDLITLLQAKLDLGFIKTMEWICNQLGISDTKFEKREIVKPFGGYYSEIKREIYNIDESDTYEESILDEFGITPNMRFLKDGITIQTQEKYHIGYDVATDRITVPWRNICGEIVGIMGRLNYDDEDLAKWFPIISFSKNTSIFGLYENYNSIIEKDICIVGESEKTSLVLDSFDIPVGVGLGGNVMSEYKANLIKSTRVGKILIAMDEGLDESISIKNAMMCKSDTDIYKNRVGYIYDRDNKYLPKESKMSPYDLGKDTLQKLIKECVIWI